MRGILVTGGRIHIRGKTQGSGESILGFSVSTSPALNRTEARFWGVRGESAWKQRSLRLGVVFNDRFIEALCQIRQSHTSLVLFVASQRMKCKADTE